MSITDYTKYYASEDFDPEDLEFYDWFDQQSPIYVITYDNVNGIPTNPRIATDADGQQIKSNKGLCLDLLREKGYGEFQGHCQHCGQGLRYCVIYRNIHNGEHIVVGETCAEERMGLTLDAFRKRQEQAVLQRAATIAWQYEQHSLWMEEDPTRQELIDWLVEQHSDFFFSVYAHYRVNGKISGKQEETLRRIRQEHEEKVQTKNQEMEEKNITPVPTGKGLIITGVVKSVKWQENDYGGSLKMRVEHTDGWQVWGTVPSSIDVITVTDGAEDGHTWQIDLPVGSTIQFTANVAASNDDPGFGFFKRPRQATILDPNLEEGLTLVEL